MLKTVSSITNAIGALNYKGIWDANTNTPARFTWKSDETNTP